MMNDINDIYNELKKKINPTRLKEISVDIIQSYKEKNRDGLLFYADLLSIDHSDINISKLFAQIIQNYHPDKTLKILKEIELFYKNNKIDELLRLKQVFIFKKIIQESPFRHDINVDESYSYSDEDFGYDEKNNYDDDRGRENEFEDREDHFFEDHEYGFIEAINRLVFGNLDFTINIQDLQSLEGELDLSDYEICDLKGIEYCMNINNLNLSGNNVYKIEPLSRLTQLESLFLSENNIQNIDCLSELVNLKELDISFNEVEDISVLNKLESLLYVNVLGNPIKDTHMIKELTERGVLVIY
jgi:Leucine-rich repeat (LRR) protein